MATRSTIALEHADGTVSQIYCHWDGYLDHNGVILKTHYADPGKVSDLIALGDISYLGKELGQKHDFDNPTNRDWCLAYGRDRGEPGVDARTYPNFRAYDTAGQHEEYNYIMRGGVWYVDREGMFDLLEEAMRETEC
jgi:hypothetical protein